MKFKIFVAVVLVGLAWMAGRHFSQGSPQDAEVRQAFSDTERVINDSYQLEPGARVEVSGINGPVEVITIDGQTAEVHVETVARGGADPESRKITVQQTATGLSVRGENQKGSGFWRWLAGGGGGEVRHNITLRVPRRIELTTRGVNGRVHIGEINGPVRLSGINGKVEVERASESVEVSGINGAISVGVTDLNQAGVRVSGVNGGVEVRFGEGTNADVTVNGLNGGFSVDAPDVTAQEQPNRSSRRVRIGTGGTPISINGVNGSIRLNRM